MKKGSASWCGDVDEVIKIWSWMALKVSKIILYWIRQVFGSQWSFWRMGEMCRVDGVLAMTRAAWFCATCTLWMDF